MSFPCRPACLLTVRAVHLMPGQTIVQACCYAHKTARHPRHAWQLSILSTLPLMGPPHFHVFCRASSQAPEGVSHTWPDPVASMGPVASAAAVARLRSQPHGRDPAWAEPQHAAAAAPEGPAGQAKRQRPPKSGRPGTLAERARRSRTRAARTNIASLSAGVASMLQDRPPPQRQTSQLTTMPAGTSHTADGPQAAELTRTGDTAQGVSSRHVEALLPGTLPAEAEVGHPGSWDEMLHSSHATVEQPLPDSMEGQSEAPCQEGTSDTAPSSHLLQGTIGPQKTTLHHEASMLGAAVQAAYGGLGQLLRTLTGRHSLEQGDLHAMQRRPSEAGTAAGSPGPAGLGQSVVARVKLLRRGAVAPATNGRVSPAPSVGSAAALLPHLPADSSNAASSGRQGTMAAEQNSEAQLSSAALPAADVMAQQEPGMLPLASRSIFARVRQLRARDHMAAVPKPISPPEPQDPQPEPTNDQVQQLPPADAASADSLNSYTIPSRPSGLLPELLRSSEEIPLRQRYSVLSPEPSTSFLELQHLSWAGSSACADALSVR